jgi:hypothetical protein
MDYSEQNGKVVNSQGQVAVQHFNANEPAIQIEGTDVFYKFVAQHQVSMAWIDPQYLERVLLTQESCNCANGRKFPKFSLCPLINVCIWYTGDRCK